VTFGVNVTSIDEGAFYECSHLRNVVLPPLLTNIAIATFEYCTRLTNVVIGPNVWDIGSGAFTYSGLTNITLPDCTTVIEDGAFQDCSNLYRVFLGANVMSIGQAAFYACSNLHGIYFKGNMPTNANQYAFLDAPKATAYYLPGTAGWTNTFDGLPTAFWTLPYPLILNNRPVFGIQSNQFTFTISWATNKSVIVQVCTNLAKPAWQAIRTNALTAGLYSFSDPQWTNYRGRYYRISSP